MQPKSVRRRCAGLRSRICRDDGQIIVLVALSTLVLFAIVGLAVDIGRMYIAKAELSRAMDAAALAGVLELPDADGAIAVCEAYLQANEPRAHGTCSNPGENQIKATASLDIQTLFIGVIGLDSAGVSAHAVAGFGVNYLDAYVAIDATGSMGASPCNSDQDNSDCPIWEAKQAATSFVNTLMGVSDDGRTLIGAGAFRGCYNPPQTNPGPTDTPTRVPTSTRTPTRTAVPTRTRTPRPGSTSTRTPTFAPHTATPTRTPTASPTRVPATSTPDYSSRNVCVRSQTAPTPQVVNLTSDKNTLTSTITNFDAVGGSGTNVCGGMKMGEDVLFGASHHTEDETRRYLIIVSDGDNTYNAYSYNDSPASPDPDCQPDTSPNQSDGNVSSSCSNAQTRERELDTKTYELASSLKQQGVEIYVIGFGVCGTATDDVCDTSKIGGTSSDNTADANLLKCIASSRVGSNDHFYEADTASSLPTIFTNIARQIAHRLIE